MAVQTTQPIGYQSAVVNGQLVNVAPGAAFSPLAFGPAYTGPGMWPRQGVYNVPPVLPSASLQASMAPASYGQSGTYPLPSATDHQGNPFSITASPLLWALAFLTLGLAMLYFIHYR
jgi:hypothetical protein